MVVLLTCTLHAVSLVVNAVVWLPRVMRVLSPSLVVEQGCAKQGQGAQGHLWAFLSLAEDSIQVLDGEGEGLCALFADVHKAYNQVWRDGLFLILYTQGLRGNLWQLIQAWLGGAVASTEWNGAQGPEV